jgi:hypothetical protein
MVKHTLICSAITLVACLAIGCKSSPTSATSNNDLMPLKVGNLWMYEIINYSDSGATSVTTYDTITIVSTQVTAGVTMYASNYGESYYYDSRGLWGTAQGIRSFFAKYPLAAGETMPADSVMITSEPSPDPIDVAVGIQKLVGENQLVHFPDGHIFTCQQYQRDYKGTKYDSIYFTETSSYQLGTGLVYEEFYRPNGHNGLYKSESRRLINYSIK